MSRIARSFSRSGVYHVLFCGVNQQTLFEEKADYEKLKETIAAVKAAMGFSIYAYCFMDNHVHLVLHEKTAMDISLIMKRILTKYARWYNIKYGRNGALIANRYKSVPVEQDEYFLFLIRYVHQKPVMANTARNAADYEYSSYHEYTIASEITDTDLVFSMITKDEFVKFHNEYDNLKFTVSSSNKKSDDETAFDIRKRYGINNPKEIAKYAKAERDEILSELKKNYSVRQLQRIIGISRGSISKIKP